MVAGDRQEPVHLHHEFIAIKSNDCSALKEHTREEQYWNLLSWIYLFTFLLNASCYWYTLIFACPAPPAALEPISLLSALEGIRNSLNTKARCIASMGPRQCSNDNCSNIWPLHCMLMQSASSTKKHQNSPWTATFSWTLLYRPTGN